MLLTLGDPSRLTGGHRYHRRIAELAPAFDAAIDIVGLPQRPPGYAIVRVRAAFACARDRGAACVLLDSLAAGVAAPFLTLTAPRPPLLAILHQPPGGIDHRRVRTSIGALLDRLAYRRAARLFAASQALADDVVRAGAAPPSRVVVVPPGCDVVASDRAAGDLRAGRRCAVLCAGNWIARKGILELLGAVARLPDGAVTLHLAGDDAADAGYARRVRRRLAARELAGRVVVHGPVDQAALAALYTAADVFALASTREPYGTVYGEAMSAGLPVVGWRAGNLPHLADDGVEGLLAETGDVQALAAALQRLAEDDHLRTRMGEAARRRAATFPRWQQSAAMLIGGIRSALSESS